MREIRYRAFHKREKKMYFVDRLDFSRDGTKLFYIGVQDGDRMVEMPASKFVLMQSIDDSDIYDVPIFEGDIIKAYNWQLQFITAPVIFYKFTWYVGYFVGDIYRLDSYSSLSGQEIIGHIYDGKTKHDGSIKIIKGKTK